METKEITVIPNDIHQITPESIKSVANKYGITEEQEKIILTRIHCGTIKETAIELGMNANYCRRVFTNNNVIEAYRELSRMVFLEKHESLKLKCQNHLDKIMDGTDEEAKLKVALRLYPEETKQAVLITNSKDTWDAW